jgi:hypothetical protein
MLSFYPASIVFFGLIAHYRTEEGTHIVRQMIASGPMSGIDYGTAEDDGR